MAKHVNLAELYFQDLKSPNIWGFGIKRIPIKIEGAVDIKFYSFGYKDPSGILHLGVRCYDKKTPVKLHQWQPLTDNIQQRCTEMAYALFYEIQ